jgi:hypothetical protein
MNLKIKVRILAAPPNLFVEWGCSLMAKCKKANNESSYNYGVYSNTKQTDKDVDYGLY